MSSPPRWILPLSSTKIQVKEFNEVAANKLYRQTTHVVKVAHTPRQVDGR
jgi:hypothetical protein